MAVYEIFYRDPYGNLLEVFKKFERLEFARKENEVGVMSLILPRSVDKSILRADARMEIWRTVGANTKLVGNTAWFLEDWDINSQNMMLTAHDANFLLDGRIVAYAAGSSDAAFSATAADDLMKAIVRSNLTTDAVAARDISAYLSVDTNLTLGQATTKSFSRRQVLPLLQELAQDSRERGTYLSFDVEYVDSDSLIFKTYSGQRGIDHGRASASPVILSEQFKSLEDAVYSEKHSGEKTFVYAGGQGTESARMVEEAEDTVRSGRSPFGRREAWVDARMCTTSDALQSEARAGLEMGQPEIKLTGRIVDTEGLQFMVHYDFGDITVAEFEDLSLDAHVDTVHVTVENGFESIDNRITGYL